MADESMLVSIGEMIDLAIGTPECGSVDFNMLQTVLHCLAQQLKILYKNVEIRGSTTRLPFANQDLPHVQTVNVTEYQVDLTDAPQGGVPKKTEQVYQQPQDPANDTILVVERVKKTAEVQDGDKTAAGGAPGAKGNVVVGERAKKQDEIDKSDAARRSTRSASMSAAANAAAATSGGGPGGANGGGTGSAAGTPSQAPSAIRSTEKLSLVTISKFNVLENAVEDLRNRVYGSTPNNKEILEEVRSQTNVKAITDMWTSLNVSSRLEAAEGAINKLSSLLQDVIADAALPMLPKATDLDDAGKATPKTLESRVSTAVSTHKADIQSQTGPRPGADPEENIKYILNEIAILKNAVNNATNRDRSLARKTGFNDNVDSQRPEGKLEEEDDSCPAMLNRLILLEKKVQECCDSIGKNDGLMKDQITNFQDQLEGLYKQIAALIEDLESSKLSPELRKDLEGLMDLFNTVNDMSDQLKEVHNMAVELAAEKEKRQDHINTLLEQIELLKTIKLDREDMVEAIADKADLRMVARKVSHDQFEMACDDLSKGLEHALGKLNIQEALWQQALDDIQREIGTKLDKMELSPVKDFFNNKLKKLQENLKEMASLRREVEAAGTKKKIMRDLNCISCDANAVMQTDPGSSAPQINPLPAHFSIKPYLSYELDTIRKTQAANLPQRNMHDWENIDKQMQPNLTQRVRSETNKHICNRYCGGSHTVTTPSQRVARLGHFIKQWGPDVVPLSSTLAAGDDGRLYKVTADEVPGGAADSPCTPKTPRKGEAKPPPKAVPVPECRCLEGDH